MKRLNQTESPIFVLLYVFFFFFFLYPNLLVILYFTAAVVQGRVAAVERISVLHHVADYILVPLGSSSPFWLL